MGNEYPSIPGHFKRAVEFIPDLADDQAVEELWQALCDTYGRAWAGDYEITIQCPDDREEDDDA